MLFFIALDSTESFCATTNTPYFLINPGKSLLDYYGDTDKNLCVSMTITIDNRMIEFFSNANREYSASDFPNLKHIVLMTDENTYCENCGWKFETSMESLHLFEDWLQGTNDLDNSIYLTTQSNIQIRNLTNVHTLVINFYDRIDSSVYTYSGVQELHLNFNRYLNSSNHVVIKSTFEQFDLDQFREIKELHINSIGNLRFPEKPFINLVSCQFLETFFISCKHNLIFSYKELSQIPKLKNVKLFLEDTVDLSFEDFSSPSVEKIGIHALYSKNMNLSSLANLTNLQQLHIESLCIKKLDCNELLRNRKMQGLFLDLDSLENLIFPKESMQNLTSFSCRSKELKSISKNFNNFTNIQFLELYTPKLDSFSSDFFKTVSLTYLIIEKSNMKYLPNGLKNFIQLKTLFIEVGSLKDEIEFLKKMTQLDELTIIVDNQKEKKDQALFLGHFNIYYYF